MSAQDPINERKLMNATTALVLQHVADTDDTLAVAIGCALGGLIGFMASVIGKDIALEYLQTAAEAVEAMNDDDTADLIARVPEGRA